MLKLVKRRGVHQRGLIYWRLFVLQDGTWMLHIPVHDILTSPKPTLTSLFSPTHVRPHNSVDFFPFPAMQSPGGHPNRVGELLPQERQGVARRHEGLPKHIDPVSSSHRMEDLCYHKCGMCISVYGAWSTPASIPGHCPPPLILLVIPPYSFLALPGFMRFSMYSLKNPFITPLSYPLTPLTLSSPRRQVLRGP